MSTNCDAAVKDIVKEFGADRTRLTDIALAVQQRFGFISDDAVQAIATGLGVHAVEIEDMASFYSFLDRAPRGRFRIRLSKTPISFMKGATDVARAFEEALGLSLGDTSADGQFTLEWTSDIGMADQEPSALINSTVLTALTPEDVPQIVAALRRCGPDDGPPRFPQHKPQGAMLPKAAIRSSLVQPGPLLSGRPGRADGIKAALDQSPEQVIEEISNSKLRGRGGAGFPTGMKWRLTRKAVGENRYVICNADEGEPGTFKDRLLLTEFPDLVFDGMTIAGYALGARRGVVYLRGEYAYLWDPLQEVLRDRRALGLLGADICGRSGFDFDIRIQLGAGAYMCGEESALLESMEGKRGAPRDRPPFPTERGYLRQPTAIDNVETFACAARIVEKGAAWFTGFGTKESTGTKLMSVSGDCQRPGVYEVPFGITVNELLDLVGAPDAEYVQISGPSGQSVAPKDFGRRIAYEDLSTGGSTMIFGPNRDVLDIVLQFADFFVHESCGWCAPCRVGAPLLKQGMEKIVAGRATLADIAATEALANTVMRMSRCGLGQTAPNPILTTMLSFPELYEARLAPVPFEPLVPLRDALREAVEIQGREPAPQEP
ncbi:Respiratory-chain NADH dehydrogenase domain 51 kDa subunit [Methylocella silvestris BL2]|uniref:Respiratory-chain NADH dehydrogenase domain 51 kDa subunit n=1 Tax=Methylocella silvestris (strain DSM 15510 / CIP 108128 / LMG 27833 / NCIMB 13906 / BL2) TaxID=395965 RepID=B8ERX4_METSB|nr:NAD(P)H-dependent oxidoreductase subunit E [Methylocella silvestris]ACK51672.1 Respiratory-chain NADH dehydrogenase domain 51 kDa subunit [Methylocella silvestris BL2]